MKKKSRHKHEVISGARISCWDTPKYVDRYAVVYLDTLNERGCVEILTMSGQPFHPQGVGQHTTMRLSNAAYRGRGGAFDKRICFADLPADCQRAVLDDIAFDKEQDEQKSIDQRS